MVFLFDHDGLVSSAHGRLWRHWEEEFNKSQLTYFGWAVGVEVVNWLRIKGRPPKIRTYTMNFALPDPCSPC